MTTRHVASAFLAVSLSAVLAASCAEDTAIQPIETKDDDGDVGSDPDTSGSIGWAPALPDYTWSAPTCDPSDGDGDSDPDPPPDTSGGYSPSPAGRSPARPTARPPAVMPLAPCEHECQRDYEDMAANCGSLESTAEHDSCTAAAYASYKNCRDTCQKNSDDDCLKHCKEMCYEAMMKCNDACKQKKVKDRPACYDRCNQVHGRCIHECEQHCK